MYRDVSWILLWDKKKCRGSCHGVFSCIGNCFLCKKNAPQGCDWCAEELCKLKLARISVLPVSLVKMNKFRKWFRRLGCCLVCKTDFTFVDWKAKWISMRVPFSKSSRTKFLMTHATPTPMRAKSIRRSMSEISMESLMIIWFSCK